MRFVSRCWEEDPAASGLADPGTYLKFIKMSFRALGDDVGI